MKKNILEDDFRAEIELLKEAEKSLESLARKRSYTLAHK